MKKLLVAAFLLFVISMLQSKAEDVKSLETSGTVPELMEFHEVIYQIWHEAWPEKNVKMLKELLPEIEKGVSKIEKAKLPGILREKESKWKDGVKELGSIFSDYKANAEKNNSDALLKSAEKLHAQFENLVRIIRPVMKEIDAYHVVLYELYHYYLPNYNFNKIKSSVEELNKKMTAINKAEMPKRIAEKKEKFIKSKSNLETSLSELYNVVKSGDNKEKITKAVELMHSRYQDLVAVFE